MAIPISTDKILVSEIGQRDSSVLDLVFAMDCTSSMGPYINSAKENIRLIVDEIITNEKSNIHLALIEYRDHPPQDSTFVTRVHDFTDNVEEMKKWLHQCQAQGGGDTPEAVADALHEVLTLSWRSEATKICILISDAPPHGLDPANDSFPNGCPLGLDPVKIVRQMAENNITLYTVGVEPPIIPYCDFFMTLAYITGGQYVPLVNATLLAQVIIGGVCEEISLGRVMNDAQQEIAREIQQAEEDGVDEQETAIRINRIFSSKNIRVKQMRNTFGTTTKSVEECYSKCTDMPEIQSKYKMTKARSRKETEEMSYALKEDHVTVEQAKRLIQKVKNRRPKKSTLTAAEADEKAEEKPRSRRNNRDDQKEDGDKPKLRRRQLKVDITDEKQLENQDTTEKQPEIMKKRGRNHRNTTDVRIPKQRRNNKKSNEIFDSSKIQDDTIDDNITTQSILETDQVHVSVQSNNTIFYIILFSTVVIIVTGYFSFFK